MTTDGSAMRRSSPGTGCGTRSSLTTAPRSSTASSPRSSSRLPSEPCATPRSRSCMRSSRRPRGHRSGRRRRRAPYAGRVNGQSASVEHLVTHDDTARALGSGDLDVLATPRVLAWCEEATCAALDLDDNQTSVGTRVDLEHLAASPVGAQITSTATVSHTDGRLVRFQVAALDAAGKVLATGEIRRVVVDRERFLARINAVGD